MNRRIMPDSHSFRTHPELHHATLASERKPGTGRADGHTIG
jgi:hypothetical protein